MTRGARPHGRADGGRGEQGEGLLAQAGGKGGKMQQSRAGSLLAGNPFPGGSGG